MSKIIFLGGGSFGIFLVVLFVEKNNIINIYNRDKNIVDEINSKRINEKYMKNLIIFENVIVFNDIDKVIEGVDYIILLVFLYVIRSMCEKIKGKIFENVLIILIVKGIEEGSNKRLLVVIEEEFKNLIVVLLGLSYVEEVVFKFLIIFVSIFENMEYVVDI